MTCRRPNCERDNRAGPSTSLCKHVDNPAGTRASARIYIDNPAGTRASARIYIDNPAGTRAPAGTYIDNPGDTAMSPWEQTARSPGARAFDIDDARIGRRARTRRTGQSRVRRG